MADTGIRSEHAKPLSTGWVFQPGQLHSVSTTSKAAQFQLGLAGQGQTSWGSALFFMGQRSVAPRLTISTSPVSDYTCMKCISNTAHKWRHSAPASDRILADHIQTESSTRVAVASLRRVVELPVDSVQNILTKEPKDAGRTLHCRPRSSTTHGSVAGAGGDTDDPSRRPRVPPSQSTWTTTSNRCVPITTHQPSVSGGRVANPWA